MAESRIRRAKSKGFFSLYRDSAQDVRLSLEARGLFALMMSLPDDWEYSVSGLAVKAGCGKDKIRRILGELQTVGYLIREQSHDSGGKFAGNIYVLQDEAPPLYGNSDNGYAGKTVPLSGNTDNGKTRQRENPSSGLTTQQIIDITDSKTNIPPKAPQGGRRGSKYDLAEDAKPLLRAYCGADKELAQALADLIGVRRELRAINSKRGIKALLAQLDDLSKGDRQCKILLLRQSTANSWKSVFPLKGGGAIPCGSDRIQEEEGTYLL